MKLLGKFTVESTVQELRVECKSLQKGINNLNNFFVKIGDHDEVIYVINKICDHAGGKLIHKGEKAVCPMHNWQLNLDSLEYNNSHVKKSQVHYTTTEDGQLIIDDAQRKLNNQFCPDKKGEVTIRWINHATVLIECKWDYINDRPLDFWSSISYWLVAILTFSCRICSTIKGSRLCLYFS